MTEAEIEAHNRREMWRDVINHLTVAEEALDQARDGLEDLGENDTLVDLAEAIHTEREEMAKRL